MVTGISSSEPSCRFAAYIDSPHQPLPSRIFYVTDFYTFSQYDHFTICFLSSRNVLKDHKQLHSAHLLAYPFNIILTQSWKGYKYKCSLYHFEQRFPSPTLWFFVFFLGITVSPSHLHIGENFVLHWEDLLTKENRRPI